MYYLMCIFLDASATLEPTPSLTPHILPHYTTIGPSETPPALSRIAKQDFCLVFYSIMIIKYFHNN